MRMLKQSEKSIGEGGGEGMKICDFSSCAQIGTHLFKEFGNTS